MGKIKKNKIAIKKEQKFENTIGKVKKNNKLVDGESYISLKKVPTAPVATAVQSPEIKYPILADMNLREKLLSVKSSNNQRGRLRQVLRDSLKGTSDNLLPDLLNEKLQAILKSPNPFNDTNLRKARVLFNMLKTKTQENINSESQNGVKTTKEVVKKTKKDVKKTKDVKNCENNNENKIDNIEKKEKDSSNAEDDSDTEMTNGVVENDNKLNGRNDSKEMKKKGPKRYVVFVGNLPLDITKETILSHFEDIQKSIKNVRIPASNNEKKSSIAYLEIIDELSYELALSKNHTMLNNRRINVLYSTQQNSKITKTEAKGKAAKLAALQKSGQLIGSIPVNRKRSARRKKQREAQAKLEAENNQ